MPAAMMPSAVSFTAVLPGYEAQLSDGGVEHSEAKLSAAAAALREQLHECSAGKSVDICERPCLREDETLSYRCRVTFQLLCSGGDGVWEYAMRTNKKAVPINCSHFPIATLRIQVAMDELMRLFNDDTNEFAALLSARPASISFASSWADDKDLTVTINYTEQLPALSTDEESKWLSEADEVRRQCRLTSLTGRSRKRKLVSYDQNSNDEGNIVIRDSITIYYDVASGNTIDVLVGDRQPPHEGDICIKYEKPEDAFAHPNGNAMKMALSWILTRMTLISSELRNDDIGLLEMYCGCGAHTVPIAKVCSNISFISCVELDERLIMACQKNLRLNRIDAEFKRPDKGLDKERKSSEPVVQLFRGDAGEWAKKSMHKLTSRKKTEEVCNSNTTWYGRDYTILLVDPPRAGLSADVCQLAIEGSFQHIIYISCGKEALLRDLAILSSMFEIADCTLIDLFPRTDAVESLVHLRRRQIAA